MGRLDLAGADTTPPDLLLYRLRRLFPNIPFPSFSLALADHGRRLHPEQVFGSDRRELLQGAGPYADVLAGALETAALMPEVHGLLLLLRIVLRPLVAANTPSIRQCRYAAITETRQSLVCAVQADSGFCQGP